MTILERMGLRGPIRLLTKEQKSLYRSECLKLNRVNINATRRKNRQDRIEIIREQKRDYYINNRDKVLMACKTYRDRNLDKRYAQQKEWRSKNREVLILKKREDYIKNKTKRREAAKKWRACNPNWQKEYQNKNRLRIRAWGRSYSKARRRKHHASRVPFQPSDWSWHPFPYRLRQRVILQQTKLRVATCYLS